MSAEAQANVEQKPTDKEYNFRQIEKRLQEERQAREQEAAARQELEREIQKLKSKAPQEEEDDDSEPFVDHKRLNKKLARFGEQYEKTTENKIQNAVQHALREERKQSWVESNPDFYDTLQHHAEKLSVRAPKLAESILRMPDGFERQQLVYNTIKSMGLDKPEPKESSIQEKIDANRKAPYYQPTGIGNAPYSNAGDFSDHGQKNAYDKMKELQKRLRLG